MQQKRITGSIKERVKKVTCTSPILEGKFPFDSPHTASNQTYQRLQIRALLIAQQTALATKAQADENKESIQKAAHKQFWSTSDAPVHMHNEGFKFDQPPR